MKYLILNQIIFSYFRIREFSSNIYSINLNFNGNLFKEINNLKTKLAFSLKRFQKKTMLQFFFQTVNTYEDFQKYCNFKIKNSRKNLYQSK